jgi:hypothetical protein
MREDLDVFDFRDFGTGAPVLLPDGKRRRTHVFRIVLSRSHKGYSEAVYRQSTDDFLRCLENALWHFGGAPQRLILDICGRRDLACGTTAWLVSVILGHVTVRSYGEIMPST